MDLHVTIFIWYCKRQLFWLSGVKGDNTNTCRHRQQGDIISLLLFFQNKECRLEMVLKEWGVRVFYWILLAQDRI
jgi:hypothetical protein